MTKNEGKRDGKGEKGVNEDCVVFEMIVANCYTAGSWTYRVVFHIRENDDNNFQPRDGGGRFSISCSVFITKFTTNPWYLDL